MGTHGSPLTRVLEVSVKWIRRVISPADLQVGPETLSTTLTTLEDSRRPYPNPGGSAECVEQESPQVVARAASRSADRGIHPVITEDDLTNL
jgi:hypothetical protein